MRNNATEQKMDRRPRIVFLCTAQIFFLLLAAPLQAEPICGVLQISESIEAASQRLVSSEDHRIAAGEIGRIQRALHVLSGFTFTQGSPEPGNGSAAYAINAFAESRGRLVEIFRTDGLEAAQEYIQDPAFAAIGQEIATLEGQADCDMATVSRGTAGPSTREESRSVSGPRSGVKQLRHTGIASGTIFQISFALLPLLLIVAVCCLLYAYSANKREHRRYPCNIPTEVRIGGRSVEGRIVNISRRGAMLRFVNSLAPGAAAEILLNGARHEAKVAWANPNFIGIKFKRKLEGSPSLLVSQHDTRRTRGSGADPARATTLPPSDAELEMSFRY